MAVSTEPVISTGNIATGDNLVKIGNTRVGQKYVLGALAPKDNAEFKGPWDCAEFVSWVIFQATSKLYGCEDNNGVPAKADSFTGYFARDAKALGIKVSVDEAIATAGALLLRTALPNLIGHIVISDGNGGTVEAHGRIDGVINGKVTGRRWDVGILVPGVAYQQGPAIVVISPDESKVLRVTKPLTKSAVVGEIQKALLDRGFDPQGIDNVYGENTARAVLLFQRHEGLVVDGEVGEKTAAALGVTLA